MKIYLVTYHSDLSREFNMKFAYTNKNKALKKKDELNRYKDTNSPYYIKELETK